MLVRNNWLEKENVLVEFHVISVEINFLTKAYYLRKIGISKGSLGNPTTKKDNKQTNKQNFVPLSYYSPCGGFGFVKTRINFD